MIERGRSTYQGFAATIKLVGTGARGSRDLTFDEARDAMGALLAGETSDAQAGAFLIAMRLKGEAPPSWRASPWQCVTPPRRCRPISVDARWWPAAEATTAWPRRRICPWRPQRRPPRVELPSSCTAAPPWDPSAG